MANRDVFVSQMRAYLGAKTGNAKHKHIIDTYNAFVRAGKSAGSKYIMKYNDPWCATTVSSASIECGYTDIIPTECSCTRMIELLKSKCEFEPDDNFIPSPGHIIFYRWKMDGGREPIESEDVDGIANHVGVVESCDGKTIVVIEGNYNDECKRRTIKVGWKYIHGYGIPKFDDNTTYYTVARGDNLSKIAKRYNTTVSAILALNPQITNANIIYKGQKIRVR